MKFIALEIQRSNKKDGLYVYAMGVVVFENRQLVETARWFVWSEMGCNHLWGRFSDLHGITESDIAGATEFPNVAPQILERLAKADFVAIHPRNMLLEALENLAEYYDIACPGFNYVFLLDAALQTWSGLSRFNLFNLAAFAERAGFKLEDCHSPTAEAEAVGRVILALMEPDNPENIQRFIKRFEGTHTNGRKL